MERDDWIKNRTDNPEKIGKLWWNKMYNQCCLSFGEIKDPVPQDIERKMFIEYLEHNKQTPEDIVKWLSDFHARGNVRNLFRDVEGTTASATPEELKMVFDASYRISKKFSKQSMKTANVINSAKQSIK